MGVYLNCASPLSLYRGEAASPYFIDKSMLLAELFPLVEQGNRHVCITRPRRFGKTVMANMTGAFFGKGKDAGPVFDSLKIAKTAGYEKHLNQHDVIYIDFSRMPEFCDSYEQYIGRISSRLKSDLIKAYPDAGADSTDAVWDVLDCIFNEYEEQRFIFVFDEWDCIFHKSFIKEQDKKNFLAFLSNLLKDRAYVSMTYMTGILPIAKYSSGSELNMFMEYTMVAEAKFSDAFGFTEAEVDELYVRYQNNTAEAHVTRDGLKLLYDGYHTKAGERMYNPCSVVAALTNNNLSNYWTSTEPYDVSYSRETKEHSCKVEIL